MPEFKSPKSELLLLTAQNQASWLAWLEQHHAESAGVWLQLMKKAAGEVPLTYHEALDIALCYGWIDGQRKTYDHVSFQQKFTPRGAKSIWSKVNCAKVEALIAAGRMQPAGRAAIERAKADGRWDAAYDSSSTATVPADLQAALDANARAQVFFATLNRQNRYAILFRIQTAKKPETRAKRIEQCIAMLEQQEQLYP